MKAFDFDVLDSLIDFVDFQIVRQSTERMSIEEMFDLNIDIIEFDLDFQSMAIAECLDKHRE